MLWALGHARMLSWGAIIGNRPDPTQLTLLSLITAALVYVLNSDRGYLSVRLMVIIVTSPRTIGVAKAKHSYKGRFINSR